MEWALPQISSEIRSAAPVALQRLVRLVLLLEHDAQVHQIRGIDIRAFLVQVLENRQSLAEQSLGLIDLSTTQPIPPALLDLVSFLEPPSLTFAHPGQGLDLFQLPACQCDVLTILAELPRQQCQNLSLVFPGFVPVFAVLVPLDHQAHRPHGSGAGLSEDLAIDGQHRFDLSNGFCHLALSSQRISFPAKLVAFPEPLARARPRAPVPGAAGTRPFETIP